MLCQSLFIYSLKRHVGCFQVLAVKNKAAVGGSGWGRHVNSRLFHFNV